MLKIFFKTISILLLLAIVVSIGMYIWQTYYVHTPLTQHVFKVEETDSIYTIAKKLKQEGIIKSRSIFCASYFIFGRGISTLPGGYKLSTDMKTKQIIYTLEEKPWAKYVTIPADTTKEKMGELIGTALGWNLLDKQFFGHTYAGMQWQNYEDFLRDIFADEYSWTKSKTETFLTLSSLYYDSQYDFFKDMYVPGT